LKFEFTEEEVTVAINILHQVLTQSPGLGNSPTGQVLANFIRKLAEPAEEGIRIPKGITEKEFEEICKHCDAFDGSKCCDAVAKKFPGKCDNIIKHRRNK
jgi:hypothetical protein